MAIQLNDNILVDRTLPIDSRYGPYSSVAVALASLPKISGVDVTRFVGLTVGIIENGKVVEYWFKEGTGDTNLVPKLLEITETSVSLGDKTLINVGEPQNSTDAARKADVDKKVTAVLRPDDSPITDLAPAALELRDQEDASATAIKLDGRLYNAADPDTPNPWEVRLPDQLRKALGAGAQTEVDKKVSNFNSEVSGEHQDVAPAAVELRDKEEPDVVALRYDARDENTWTVLNSELFRDAINAAPADHDHDISEITISDPAAFVADIGAQPAGSYATLVNGKIPSAELPSYVDDVIEYPDLQSLVDDDISGNQPGKIYVTLDNNKIYRWSGTTHIEIASSPGSTDVIAEGSNNLYFTSDRAAGVLFRSEMPDNLASGVVGGASSQTAAQWETRTVHQILDAILFPTLEPTYIVPTLNISLRNLSSGSTFEVGELVDGSVDIAGVKNDAGAFVTNQNYTINRTRNNTADQSYSAPFTSSEGTNLQPLYGFSNPNNPNINYFGGWTNNNLSLQVGTYRWSVSTNGYAAGLRKKNNKGVEDARAAQVRSTGAPQAAASSFSSGTVQISAIYPYFWGKSNTPPTASTIASAIAAGTTNRILASSNGTITIQFNANAEYIWFAHPSSQETAVPEKTKWYVTALNNGNIGAGQAILAPVTQNVNSPNNRWTQVPYKIYISAGATQTEGNMEFRNS